MLESLKRLFGKPSSVPPDIKPVLISGSAAAAFLEALRKQCTEQSTGIKPPADPAADDWTWQAWKAERDAHIVPGWTWCRFANRVGETNVRFVFGHVRGSFGLWQQPFDVCWTTDRGLSRSADILTCITHLPTGFGFAIFGERAAAAQAAEIAERMNIWESIDSDDIDNWQHIHARTCEAWRAAGMAAASNAHCHQQGQADVQTPAMEMWGVNPDAMSFGKPERLS
jgi:hypothetical protein